MKMPPRKPQKIPLKMNPYLQKIRESGLHPSAARIGEIRDALHAMKAAGPYRGQRLSRRGEISKFGLGEAKKRATASINPEKYRAAMRLIERAKKPAVSEHEQPVLLACRMLLENAKPMGHGKTMVERELINIMYRFPNSPRQILEAMSDLARYRGEYFSEYRTRPELMQRRLTELMQSLG